MLFIWLSSAPYLPTHDTDSWFIRTLERECLRNEVGLEKLIITLDSDGGLLLHRHGETKSAHPSLIKECMGIVYLVNWYAAVNQAVFDWLAHAGKPVSIVDWLGGWEVPSSLTGKPHIQLLSSSVTRKPGFDAGRFLITQGHRRIAYFSPYALSWPSIRLQGSKMTPGSDHEKWRLRCKNRNSSTFRISFPALELDGRGENRVLRGWPARQAEYVQLTLRTESSNKAWPFTFIPCE